MMGTVERRSLARTLVDAVVEFLTPTPLDIIRVALASCHQPTPEARLWLACIENALDSADQIARRHVLPGDHSNMGPVTRTAAAQAEADTLRLWVTGDHVGSLSWIADHVLTDESAVPGLVRKRILAQLNGAELARRKRTHRTAPVTRSRMGRRCERAAA